MPRPYQLPGLVLSLDSDTKGTSDMVRALQTDLRALGYLGSGIDGSFGRKTARAISALRFDLLNNDGASTGSDGRATVAIRDYTKGRIAGTAGVLDQGLAVCIDDMIVDQALPKLPRVDDPVGENRKAIAAIAGIVGAPVPIPFLLAMFEQESGGRHFSVPGGVNSDDFVIVGLDRNDKANPDRITSRGYGIAQSTIFHHPPRPDEVAGFIRDPVANVRSAITELGEKFNKFVVGPASRASERDAEHPALPLRPCRYAPSDSRYLEDCAACARSARRVNIVRGVPLFHGASGSYQPDQYYPSADCGAVPDRADFRCDWPYAARRYNGGGLDSFHYQTRILRNLQTVAGLPGGPPS